MKQRTILKFVHEGQYVAEVEVEILEDDTGWSPCIGIEDAHRLDDVRDALRRGDLVAAAKYGRIYELLPVAYGVRQGVFPNRPFCSAPSGRASRERRRFPRGFASLHPGLSSKRTFGASDLAAIIRRLFFRPTWKRTFGASDCITALGHLFFRPTWKRTFGAYDLAASMGRLSFHKSATSFLYGRRSRSLTALKGPKEIARGAAKRNPGTRTPKETSSPEGAQPAKASGKDLGELYSRRTQPLPCAAFLVSLPPHAGTPKPLAPFFTKALSS